ASASDSVWALVRRPGRGGVAMRLAYAPGDGLKCRTCSTAPDEDFRLIVTSVLGEHEISLRTYGYDIHMLRATVRLTPSAPLLMPFSPRDIYPLGEKDDPVAAEGRVEAAQRGLNGGFLYFHIDEPAFGNILYFQNLTALNDYFRATGARPDGAVGGEWPELGYLLPSPPQSPRPPVDPLPAGRASRSPTPSSCCAIRSRPTNVNRRASSSRCSAPSIPRSIIRRSPGGTGSRARTRRSPISIPIPKRRRSITAIAMPILTPRANIPTAWSSSR
ncbi:MAG TPA: hypothetical protein VFL92_11655, partial [Sphingomonas sp.]|nr:hypothetical protein [Sphingomonas sp.]